MKKIITLLCAALCANVLWAQTTFTVGNFTYTVIDSNSVKVSGCSAYATSVVIPSMVTDSNTITYSVTSIGYAAFYVCERLGSVTIPNSVTSIGRFGFSYCTSLSTVTIPNSVTLIDEYAFVGCTSLSTITIPNSVTSIVMNAFYNCTSLSSVTIPNQIDFENNDLHPKRNCSKEYKSQMLDLLLETNEKIFT